VDESSRRRGSGRSSEAFTELYDLRVTVEQIEGRPGCGLQEGDYFEVTESSRVLNAPAATLCLHALQSVLPQLPAKQRDLAPGDRLEQESLVACPDPEERLIMRIERIGRRRIPTAEST
jgi:uncharacterized repeat protein (TIGR04076 family)